MGYLRLLAVFLRIGTLNELAYRANFFIQSFESLVGMATILATVAVVFSQTDSLGGWAPAELVALVGVSASSSTGQPVRCRRRRASRA